MLINRRYTRGASSRIAERNRLKKRIGLVFNFFILIFLFVCLFLILRSDFLNIKKIKITGNNTISNAQIENLSNAFMSGNKLLFIPRSNVLFLDKVELASNISLNMQRIENLEISKNFFTRSLDIKVKERQEYFLYCALETCYLVDDSGFAFEKVDALNYKHLILLKPTNEQDVFMKYVDDNEKIKNYIALIEVLQSAGFKTSSIEVISGGEAHLYFDLGKIIFDPTDRESLSYARNAILLIEELKSKNSNVSFEYIDIRFGSKLFYKSI